jgi:hypothetical protein
MLICLATIAVGCSTNAPSGDRVTLDSLRFEVPTQWQRHDTHLSGVTTSVFTPPENTRRESLTVIRTHGALGVARGSEADLVRLLATAESFAGAPSGPVSAISTGQGMRGARIELDYVPPGLRQSYHRIHVVVLDGDALVHVLYTALSPDLDALALVLSTLHHEA